MSILIAGYGSAGSYLVDFLLKDHRVREEDIGTIHIMSRKSEKEVTPRIEISKVSSGISDRFVPIQYHQMNFNDIEGMTDLIKEIRPTIVVYTGRYVSGIKYGSLSYPHEIGYGVWMPLSFPYIYNLMKAVKNSGVACITVNTSFPDGVNYLLSLNGLEPTTGAGNINHLIPRIRRAASRLYKIPPKDIAVDFACSHYSNTYISKEGTAKGSKTCLTIYNRSSGDILYNDRVDSDSLKESIIYPLCKDSSAGGQIRNQMIATDCAEIVRNFISYRNREYIEEEIHLPGFLGRPGGQLIKFTKDSVDSASSYDQSEIDKVNLEGLEKDGVVITSRGGSYGIEFTDDARYKMLNVYRINYPSFLETDRIQEFADFIYRVLKEGGWCN